MHLTSNRFLEKFVDIFMSPTLFLVYATIVVRAQQKFPYKKKTEQIKQNNTPPKKKKKQKKTTTSKHKTAATTKNKPEPLQCSRLRTNLHVNMSELGCRKRMSGNNNGLLKKKKPNNLRKKARTLARK